MVGLDSRIKPLYSRILALDNFDKYLQSREFELASIELDLNEIWDQFYDSAYNQQCRQYLVPNLSIVSEKSFGETLSVFSRGYLDSGFQSDRDDFLSKISYLLVDYAKWSEVQSDFNRVLTALADLGFDLSVLNILDQEIKAVQAGKPKNSSIDMISNFEKDFWPLIHKKIVDVSKEIFDDGYYSEAIFKGITEINNQVKEIVKMKTGKEVDGVSLMRKAFSIDQPLIQVTEELESKTGKATQEGFMNLFAGSTLCLRNPSAHNNIEMDKETAIHYLFLLSILMQRLDTAKY